MKQWRKMPSLLCLLSLGLVLAGGLLLRQLPTRQDAVQQAPELLSGNAIAAVPETEEPIREEPAIRLEVENVLLPEPAAEEPETAPPESTPPEQMEADQPEPPVPMPPAPEPEAPAGAFSDALFIGDSRTVGLKEYSDLKSASYFASVGMSVYGVHGTEVEEKTLATMLDARQYGRIYVMLGINEAGTGTAESFGQEMGKLIGYIRKKQPTAVIYLESILYVTRSKSENDPIFNNENLRSRNGALAALANGSDVVYLEVNDALSDENGDLTAEYSGDGVHLKAKYYYLWSDYLKAHTQAAT